METNAYEDEQFIKWILSKTAEAFWEFDEHGEQSKQKPGWEKTQTEYNIILSLNPVSEDELKL